VSTIEGGEDIFTVVRCAEEVEASDVGQRRIRGRGSEFRPPSPVRPSNGESEKSRRKNKIIR
jgi:hypothetical protein